MFIPHITLEVVYWSGNEKLCCPWDMILKYKNYLVVEKTNECSPGQITSIRDNVPRQGHRHVLVTNQAIPVVPEVVFSVHTETAGIKIIKSESRVPPVVEEGILSPENNLVPQDHLVQLIVGRLVLRRQVQKQLLHVPIEQRVQVCLKFGR